MKASMISAWPPLIPPLKEWDERWGSVSCHVFILLLNKIKESPPERAIVSQ